MKNKLKGQGLVFILLLCVVPLAHSASISIVGKETQTTQTTKAFNDWLPADGNTVDLLVTVSDYGHSDGEIQFHFTEVSNWPRTCMNGGPNRTSGTANNKAISKQDLCLYGQPSQVFASVADARAGRRATVKHLTWEPSPSRQDGTTDLRVSWTSSANMPPGGFTIVVTVTCEDYGAFGTLQARLFKENATLGIFDIDETGTIKIPKDDNSNHIADEWEVQQNVWGRGTKATDDNEPTNVGGTASWRGDGFTAYEEYRGFFINGVHERLKLDKKDVFVHSEFDQTFYPNLLTRDQVRLGPATDANGDPRNGFPSVFKVRFIAKTEMDSDYVVNFNECIRLGGGVNQRYWKLSMKAIYIERDATRPHAPGNPWGEAYTSTDYDVAHDHPGLPTHHHGGVPHDVFTGANRGNRLRLGTVASNHLHMRNRSDLGTIVNTIVYTNQIWWQAGEDAKSSSNSQTTLYKKALGNTVSHEFAHHLGLADHNVSDVVRYDPHTGRYFPLHTGEGIMFYENHIDDEATTFNTGVVRPTTGFIQNPTTGAYSSQQAHRDCEFVGTRPWARLATGRRHHNEDVCQNLPHWIASDVEGSQDVTAMRRWYSVVETPEPKQTDLPKLYIAGTPEDDDTDEDTETDPDWDGWVPEPQLCLVTYADWEGGEPGFCHNNGIDGCATGPYGCGGTDNCCCADLTTMHPCGVHPRTASGTHSMVTNCLLYSGRLCNANNYYACQPHTHSWTYRCGNSASGASACIYGRRADSSTTAHQTTCRAGHRYWMCDRTAHAVHSLHTATSSSSGIGSNLGSGSSGSGSGSGSGSSSSSSSGSGSSSSGSGSSSSGSGGGGSGSSSSGSSGTLKCGNRASGANACFFGRVAISATSHRWTCRQGHTYWLCDRVAKEAHRGHHGTPAGSSASSGSDDGLVACGNPGRGHAACSEGGRASSEDAHRNRCSHGWWWGCRAQSAYNHGLLSCTRCGNSYRRCDNDMGDCQGQYRHILN